MESPLSIPFASGRQANCCPRFITAILMACLLLSACGGGGGIDVPGDQANGRVAITNNQQTLDARVSEVDVPVPIEAPPPAVPVLAGDAPPALAASGLSLTLVREIDSPVVEGELVQATSITMRSGSKAVVSYNMVGAPRLGAIDYFTKLKNSKPKLSSEIVFNDTDISAVTTSGNRVYAAAATDNPSVPFPAVLERYYLQSNKLVLNGNAQIGLTSFAGTSTTTTNNVVYATSGNTGEVSAYAENDLGLLGQYPLNDARWVAWDSDDDRIVVAQGTPGRLAVFAADDFPGGSMNLLNTYPFPGADVPESKTTVEVVDGKAFIAAGTEGVQIMCLNDGQIIGSVPRPDPALLGLDPSVVVTNAVTIDDDLMFISNGEAGVYVAQADEDFDDSGCDPQQITMLGHLQFGDLQSANHVAYKGDYLFVAAGLGGVKIVRVGDDDDDDDDDSDD